MQGKWPCRGGLVFGLRHSHFPLYRVGTITDSRSRLKLNVPLPLRDIAKQETKYGLVEVFIKGPGEKRPRLCPKIPHKEKGAKGPCFLYSFPAPFGGC